MARKRRKTVVKVKARMPKPGKSLTSAPLQRQFRPSIVAAAPRPGKMTPELLNIETSFLNPSGDYQLN